MAAIFFSVSKVSNDVDPFSKVREDIKMCLSYNVSGQLSAMDYAVYMADYIDCIALVNLGSNKHAEKN